MTTIYNKLNKMWLLMSATSRHGASWICHVPTICPCMLNSNDIAAILFYLNYRVQTNFLHSFFTHFKNKTDLPFQPALTLLLSLQHFRFISIEFSFRLFKFVCCCVHFFFPLYTYFGQWNSNITQISCPIFFTVWLSAISISQFPRCG